METTTVATDANTTAGIVTATTTTGTAIPNTVTATPVAEQPKQTEPKQTEKPKADNAEVEKMKAALNKACAEASEYKKALREKQTEAEREAAERAEAEKAKDARLAELERTVAISDYTNKCLALDFDAELAATTANALADGNMDTLFDCLKSFVEATKTKLANDALNRQPSLSAGVPPTTNTTQDADLERLRRYAGLPPRK